MEPKDEDSPDGPREGAEPHVTEDLAVLPSSFPPGLVRARPANDDSPTAEP